MISMIVFVVFLFAGLMLGFSAMEALVGACSAVVALFIFAAFALGFVILVGIACLLGALKYLFR